MNWTIAEYSQNHAINIVSINKINNLKDQEAQMPVL